jgi:hypothetical protein
VEYNGVKISQKYKFWPLSKSVHQTHTHERPLTVFTPSHGLVGSYSLILLKISGLKKDFIRRIFALENLGKVNVLVGKCVWKIRPLIGSS